MTSSEYESRTDMSEDQGNADGEGGPGVETTSSSDGGSTFEPEEDPEEDPEGHDD